LADCVRLGSIVGENVVCPDALHTDVCVGGAVTLGYALNDTVGEPLLVCSGVIEGLFDGDIWADSDALVKAVAVDTGETDTECD